MTPNSLAVDRKWWVLFAVGVGSLLGSVDTTAVNVTLPTIHRQLGSSVATIEWVVTIYFLVLCGLLLTGGRLGDMYGHKRMIIGGYTVFLASSACCGLAWNVSSLIVARAVQAMGAAILYSCAPAIVTANFPGNQRGRALGLLGLMVYIGSMTGPSLGGWLTDHVGWRSVFYINLPIGLAAIILCLRFVPRDKVAEQKEPFDIPGGILFMAAFAALLLGLNQGHSWGWGSPRILGLSIGAVLVLFLFCRLENRREHPLLDLSLFRITRFSTSVSSAVMNYFTSLSIMFLLPFYLIQGRGISPSRAGALMTIQPVMMAIFSPISGYVSDRIGTRVPATLGMAFLGAGTFLLSCLGSHSSLVYVGVALFMTGFGMGNFIAPNNSALMGSAPLNRRGMAAGMLATARISGMALGVGVSGAIFTSFLARNMATSLFDGVRSGFLVAATVAFIGCWTSARCKDPVREEVAEKPEFVQAN